MKPTLPLLSWLIISPFLIFTGQIAVAGSATWNTNPPSGDWNTAANWTPATVPNGPSDSATFATSSKTAVSLSSPVEVASIAFDPGASAFTATVPDTLTLTISGTGITNNSGLNQSFVTPQASPGVRGGSIQFRNSATVGSEVTLTTNGDSSNLGVRGPFLSFSDNSSAGSATIINNGNGPLTGGFRGGETDFKGASTAATATIINNYSLTTFGFGGSVIFNDQTSAGSASFTNKAAHQFGGGGHVEFSDDSNAGHASFTNEGSDSNSSNGGGSVYFYDSASAGSASFVLYGATIKHGFAPASVGFGFNSHAANATIIAHGGAAQYAAGATISFSEESHGDVAQVQLLSNATMEISRHFLPGLTIGSISGQGTVFMGQNNLTVGANNRDATFSGLLTDGGVGSGSGASLTKIGKGDLVLTFANTYTGRTGVLRGRLTVNNTTGSATGTGPVEVAGGTLGGNGIIAGTVTVGTGTATGEPSVITTGLKGGLGTLTIQKALTFDSDGAYYCALNSNLSTSDSIVAAGITISSGATLSLLDKGVATLPVGTVFTILSNTAATPIAGVFSNLPDGGTVTIGNNTYAANYEGGDGNDLTLTVAP